jgi:hypothetical protein
VKGTRKGYRVEEYYTEGMGCTWAKGLLLYNKLFPIRMFLRNYAQEIKV